MNSFGSIEEMIRYIENANNSSSKVIAKEIKEEIETEIKEQVRGYEGHLFNATNIVNDSPDVIEVEISDNQGWTSLVSGSSFKNAMYGLEGGFTWGREQSNIMDSVERTLETKVPKTYKDTMKSKGIPIV